MNKTPQKDLIFVFDVESLSLYGTGFAVGAAVYNRRDGTEVDSFQLQAKNAQKWATKWVKQNVIPNLTDIPFVEYTTELRTAFYEFYLKYKDTAEIWSDCCFPVETTFLRQIADDNIKEREFMMPYPLKDISTLIDIDIDRVAECGIEGLRKHNPLDDSRASATLLLRRLNDLYL